MLFHGGIVTTGMETSYYYTKYFSSIEDVANYALQHHDEFTSNCSQNNQLLDKDTLTKNQKFMMIHSIRSYYSSTQFLSKDNEPLWVVNEGEYRMMNTF